MCNQKSKFLILYWIIVIFLEGKSSNKNQKVVYLKSLIIILEQVFLISAPEWILRMW